MNLLRLVCYTVVLLSTTALYAQQSSIFGFLRSSISARSAGVAGSNVAQTGDVSAVVLNPATLETLDTNLLSATFIKNVLDINSGLITYSTEVEGLGRVAATINYMSYGSFQSVNQEAVAGKDFTVMDMAVGVSLSKAIDTLISYGVTLKVLHSSLYDQNSTAIALDGGLLFRLPASRTNIGLSVLNLGTQLSTYDGTSDRLPVDVRIGVNHRLRGLPLMVHASLTSLADEVPSFFDRFLNFAVGGELYIGKYVQARVGYDNTTRNTSAVNVSTQLTGLSGGIGVNTNTIDVDYAINTLGSSAILHRISIALPL